MANENTMYATPVAEALPVGEHGHRVVKKVAFLDEKGNPVDLTAATPPAAKSLTPAMLSGYDAGTDHGALVKVGADGSTFDYTMPSSIGNTVLVAANQAAARTAIGVPTATVTTEAVAAVKNKAQIKALTTLATDADLAAVVQKVNAIIAALQG